MNLSPDWVQVLAQQGWETVHWSTLGDGRATDEAIFEWARENQYIVFTHDLDFGTILAATNADAPSVIQVRTQDVMPRVLSKRIVQVLKDHAADLEPITKRVILRSAATKNLALSRKIETLRFAQSDTIWVLLGILSITAQSALKAFRNGDDPPIYANPR